VNGTPRVRGTDAVPGLCRIAIVGTTGVGKTTVARTLSARLGLRHVELDALFHERGWTEAPVEVFRRRVAASLSNDAWVVDGNYGQVRDLIWEQADTLIWLDYPLPLALVRLFRRSMRRLLTREELWNGNREEWRNHFLSRDSLFLWALQTHGRRRREYPALLRRPEYTHLRVVRLHSPGATRLWLAHLAEPT
jgi:adenylate kinase family enzyme